MRSPLILAVASLALLHGAATAGTQTCEGRPTRNLAEFVQLAVGEQLQDMKTGLIWARCIEDQSWNGATCIANDPDAVNPGPRITFADALSLAASKSSAQERWRIPTKAELMSLREAGCYNPSVSLQLFPTMPAWSSDGFFWTSTREADGVAIVSAISSSDAWSRTDGSKTNHVRLVRTPPKQAR